MADQKTTPTDVAPQDFLAGVEPPRRRAQGEVLLQLFDRVTGWKARMWGPSIIGYGRYDYTYASGRTGSWLATGFSPRKAALSIYIMPGYQDYSEILSRLGPHRLGKSCLYITRLDAVDMTVLEELIRTGLKDLTGIWPVHPQ
ncbi:DUF1801 domain-containing protein [Pseudooceanicola nitratireducens]|jgi:hypothetical protein|uniref:YdhG-like domain-containing protein n=1 Tax=Pseudooceanicola nitratireducens TaxID=517719 RepID=A0A1I1P058_9RHOB|nr:DUF1801 domain-containing protein [Pseudooceanicola nitratireducens]MBY6156190.1 DUF1801 domain-containing protein [Pseudooceanicola nitratireducens]SEI67108.1 protein of unknown function (DU1801) [Pseudooceanicola nitratireducens]SFC99340.1 protein of unknown function (DU1801) [Pseudooceanicola nitratireducens]